MITQEYIQERKLNLKTSYKYVNSILKAKDSLLRFKVKKGIYNEVKDMYKLINNSFQSVFIVEMFVASETEVQCINMGKIQMEVIKVLKMVEVDVRKAVGPDGVAGWIPVDWQNNQ